jgi:hypothetical protein
LASIYTKLEAWHDSNICLDKAGSIDFFHPKCWHVKGKNRLLIDHATYFVRSLFQGMVIKYPTIMLFSQT